MKGTIMTDKTKTKFESTVKFVKKNKTSIACGAGVVFGVALATAVLNDRSLILTPKNLQHLRDGGALQYDTSVGPVLATLTSNINFTPQG